MNVLVTAGNTLVPIDRVRAITNIFTGRTGAAIAREAHIRSHTVTLLTSHPEVTGDVADAKRWRCHPYRTFDELRAAMADALTSGRFDAVIHCAAVSDYRVDGTFAPAPGTRFHTDDLTWHAEPAAPALLDRAAGKVKSDEAELWLRLVRLPKLIDLIRTDWAFRGILVKFKLEVEVSETQLLHIAERSRQHSRADWMVANTLDGAKDWAYLGNEAGYRRIARAELASRLLDAIETQHREATHG